MKIYQVDVFTARPLAGNAAGVVPEAAGLSDASMRAIARELNNSETAFLFPPRGPGHDFWVRFFTPTAEVPLCGHATLAAQAVRSLELGETSSRGRQGAAGGLWEVESGVREGQRWVAMRQSPLALQRELSPSESEEASAVLGLGPGDLAEGLPIQLGTAGHAKVLVPVATEGALWRLAPDLPALRALSDRVGCPGWLVASVEHSREGAVAARMFAPAIGIAEDPVNGSGQGPLAAYLFEHGLAPEPSAGGAIRFTCRMGDAVQRPGEARVTLELEQGRPAAARVEGDVAIAFQAELALEPEPGGQPGNAG